MGVSSLTITCIGDETRGTSRRRPQVAGIRSVQECSEAVSVRSARMTLNEARVPAVAIRNVFRERWFLQG